MFTPIITGVIDRRILVNYRVAPDRLARILPAPFRPQLVNGYAIAGICLIRLKGIRPRWMPMNVGLGSENAAHRIAVEWDDNGVTQSGVYVPRRDTSSLLNVLVGGRLFPGCHFRARFATAETEATFHVEMRSDDGVTHVQVDGSLASALPGGSVFESVASASKFFEAGSLGYSPDSCGDCYDALELRSLSWKVQPLAIENAKSSFFDDQEAFPEDSIALDHALLMRGIDHEWHSRDSMPAYSAVTPTS